MVRDIDPEGERTLGVITKPDIPPAGSGSEETYIELAQNFDIVFKLGWHVVKNRTFKEKNASLAERRILEDTFFRTTNWKCLPKESVGVEALKRRLSVLLFEHVKKELPNLREELESKLVITKAELDQLGQARSSGGDCKTFLAQLSLEFYETCKAAVDGHYEGGYFHEEIDPDFELKSISTICRTRAVVQSLNSKYAEDMRTCGHKYHIDMTATPSQPAPTAFSIPSKNPKPLKGKDAIEWARKALIRNRGKELIGNFNPLLIGELYWEMSERWQGMAAKHIDSVAEVCTHFLKALLRSKCPEDVERRIWASKIQEELKSRHRSAVRELGLLMEDHANFPINYNHYYTDTITKRRQERQKAALSKSLSAATTQFNGSTEVNMEKLIESYTKDIDPNMDNFSCEEALDCLLAIYKVQQKTFVANVTQQVIERHIVRGLEKIFSPVFVSALGPEQAEALASEPPSARRKREHLCDQIQKLEEGHEIFRNVM